MLHVEQLVTIVVWLAIAVLSVDVGLVLYVLYRRAARRRYYAQRDRALLRFSPVLAGSRDLASIVKDLRAGRSRAERDAIEELLLGDISNENRHQRSELLVGLGFVAGWAQQAFGRRRGRELSTRPTDSVARHSIPHTRFGRVRRLRLFAVPRALAVARLGKLDPDRALVFLVEALSDPSPLVRRMAVAAMGNNHVGHSVPALLRALEDAVEGHSSLAIRPIKTAMVRQSVALLQESGDYLNHSNPQLRFLLVDSIREVCRSSAGRLTSQFPQRLHDWFVERAPRDESADVRARSAEVIRHFYDDQAKLALRALLKDENEFVRLHAIRACSDAYYADLMDDVVTRVTDVRWRVREAAVKVLVGFGLPGLERLTSLLLSTTDQYASEQIGDQLQRSGALTSIFSALQTKAISSRTVLELCSKLVHLGMVSMLADLALKLEAPEARALLLDALMTAPTPNTVALLQRVAADVNDPLHNKAELLLREHAARDAALAGKGRD